MSAKALTFAVFALSILSVFAQFDVGSCSRNYTIQSNETCNTICQKNDISLSQLLSLNKEIDSDCSNLQFNTTLCISSPLSPDCSPLYTVQPNDTCTSIANALNISYSILYLNNPQTENQCTDINVGEVLCVNGSAQWYLESGVTGPPTKNAFFFALVLTLTALYLIL